MRPRAAPLNPSPPHRPPQACSTTAAELLAWRRRLLQLGGQRVDLDWLLEMVGGLDWATLQRLRLDPQRTVTLAVPPQQLEQLWQRHCRSAEPLQYLAGLCPWRDFTLAVAPGVLIPRQETEVLVELAVELTASRPPRAWADLGTGSGCLAVALAHCWPRSRGWAVDCSDLALAQARGNLQAAGVAGRVELLQGGWWQPLQPWWGLLELVVANPPYIPTAVWAELEPVVRDHEPVLALDGGVDGLEAIRAIVGGACEALAPGGLLLLEHHHDQSPAVQALLHAAELEAVAAHPDLEGVSRFASARRPGGPIADPDGAIAAAAPAALVTVPLQA